MGAKDYLRRSRLSLGVAVICLVFLGETAVAHRSAPHPASPLIWSVLGAMALGAALHAAWCRRRWRRLQAAGCGG